MIRHLGRFIVLAVLLSVTFIWPVRSENDDHAPIRVAYEEFPPYSFTDENGRARGLSIDLMEHLAQSSGIDVTFIPALNPAEMLALVDEGAVQSTSLLALTPERLEGRRATLRLGAFQTQLFVLSGSDVAQISDMSGKRIGVVEGAYSVTAAGDIPFAQLVTYPSTDAMIIPLLTGEIDGVVSASDSFLARLRQGHVDELISAIDPPLRTSDYGFVLHADQTALQAAFDQTIQSRLSNGETLALNERWFGKPTTLFDKPVFWWSLGGGIFGATVLAVMMILNISQRKKSHQLLSENGSNRLLIDALNEVHAAIVIFDRDLRVVHWNEGFAKVFPELSDVLARGTTFEGLIVNSYVNKSVLSDMEAKEAADFARDLSTKIRSGKKLNRIVHSHDGRVLEARDFMLGEDHFASIRVDVTRLHDQQQTIKAQAEALGAKNEQLSTFAAIAAHDLKAPLVKQKMLMDFVVDDMAEADLTLPVDVESHFATMGELSDSMSGLIHDLLDYARADSSIGQPEEIDPVARIESLLALSAVNEGFEVSVDPDLPHVIVDPAAFDAVMRNLINNAVKHHDRPQGHIHIRSHSSYGHRVFEIEDDGPGVPEKYQKSIFEPFKRLTSNVDGSGLGLAFIKKTVEAWDGEIWVTHASERGSIFSFTVPIRNEAIVPFPSDGDLKAGKG